MIPGLDGLRALAFFMVFAFHTDYLPFGWTGVQLFFVLSGFLITGILIEMKEQFAGKDFFIRFYGRRVLRIFPVYYVYLLLFGLIAAIVIDYELIPRDGKLVSFREQIPYALTYLYNFFYSTDAAKHTSMLSHFWSLAVEEQFYLIAPMLIFITPKQHLKTLFFAALIVSPLLRAATFFAHNPISNLVALRSADAVVYFMPWSYLDAFAMGGLLNLIKLPKPKILLAALIVLVPGARYVWFLMRGVPVFDAPYGLAAVWEYTLMSALFAMMIYCVAKDGLFNRILDLPPIRYAGKISYGLYIFHNPIIYLLQEYSDLDQVGVAIVSLIVTFILAMISYRYMEAPLLGFKDRLFPRN
jgi:peptidoglycan/LPS O-acetylase OafA/YrhL